LPSKPMENHKIIFDLQLFVTAIRMSVANNDGSEQHSVRPNCANWRASSPKPIIRTFTCGRIWPFVLNWPKQEFRWKDNFKFGKLCHKFHSRYGSKIGGPNGGNRKNHVRLMRKVCQVEFNACPTISLECQLA
jgi:hypothetical protein